MNVAYFLNIHQTKHIKNLAFLCVFLMFLGFTHSALAQNSFEGRLTTQKNKGNLEEYLYTFFDEYLKTKNVDLLKKGIQTNWREPKTANEKIALLHLKINIAYFYLQSGDFLKSINYYENSLLYYQKNNIDNYNIIESCLKPLANNYTRLGDFERAEDLYKYTINIALKNTDKQALIGTYYNLAILLSSLNKNNEALDLLEKALKISSISIKQKQKIKTAITKNYYALNKYKQALVYLSKLDNNYQNNLTKGLCFYKLNEFEKAKKYINQSLKLSTENNVSKREIAKTYNHLAKIQFNTNKPLKSLENYQQSLIILLAEFNPENSNENPLENNLFAENTLLDALDGKAIIFTSQNKFKNAIENYQLASKVAQLLTQTQSSQQAKIIHQQNNRKRIEKIVALYYEQYKKTLNTDFIIKAFKSVELSKSTVLLEKLKANLFKNQHNDSLLVKEQQLVKEKAIITKNIKLEELKNEKAAIDLIKKLITKKAILTTNLEVLKTKIKSKYPLLTKTTNSISVKEIQEDLLSENQLLIEFFDTPNNLYIFSIYKNKPITWRVINKDEKYNQSLQTFINLFNTNNGNNLKNKVATYQKTAYYLYKQLLYPELSNELNLLSIIPDGKLNFIAFDALLTKKTNYENFEKLPYLVYDKQVNYGYSSTILLSQQNKIKPTKSKSVIGFFPYFKNNHRNLQELTYTLNEQKALNNFSNKQVLTKENASKSQFLNQISNYNIIHLSTHASAGGFEEPAHIEFFNKTLYLPEIYGLKLTSDLLVLSACETGIGKLQKGEGAISLSRGFLYAGIKNLIVSQWKVNDKSTSILMQNFYSEYNNSKSYSNAIRQAKINYLQDKSIANLKKTPYYWAGFVFIGNNQTTVNTQINIYLIGLLIALFGFLFFYFKKTYKW